MKWFRPRIAPVDNLLPFQISHSLCTSVDKIELLVEGRRIGLVHDPLFQVSSLGQLRHNHNWFLGRGHPVESDDIRVVQLEHEVGLLEELDPFVPVQTPVVEGLDGHLHLGQERGHLQGADKDFAEVALAQLRVALDLLVVQLPVLLETRLDQEEALAADGFPVTVVVLDEVADRFEGEVVDPEEPLLVRPLDQEVV